MMNESEFCCNEFRNSIKANTIGLTGNPKTDEWKYYMKLTDMKNAIFSKIEFCPYCGISIKPDPEHIQEVKEHYELKTKK